MIPRGSLPNLITGMRLVCVPAVLWLILADRLAPAFWLFLLAAASDAVDGALARLLHAQSALGSYLDALADKVLLVCVYLALGSQGRIGGWLVALVVLRDLLLVAGAAALHLWRRQNRVTPLPISKLNTLAQTLLAGLVLGHGGLGWFPGELELPLSGLVAATTVASGLAYLLSRPRRNRRGPGEI